MNSAAPSLSQQYLRSRIGKVCVAIIGSTAAEMVDRATEAVRDSPFWNSAWITWKGLLPGYLS